MDGHEIRRANLIALINQCDSRRAFAEKVGTDPAYLSQILSTRTARGLGAELARRIERAFDLEHGWMDRVHDEHEVREPAPSYTSTVRVPVVGTAQLGDNGFYEETGYPPGQGDGFIAYPTRDKNAYALRVKGDSMRPRIKPGEFVLIEPNTPPQSGDEVLVRTTDGRSMVKVLDYSRDGVAQFSSVNEEHRPMTIELSKIERLHYVAAIIKAGMYYREMDG